MWGALYCLALRKQRITIRIAVYCLFSILRKGSRPIAFPKRKTQTPEQQGPGLLMERAMGLEPIYAYGSPVLITATIIKNISDQDNQRLIGTAQRFRLGSLSSIAPPR